MEEDNKLKLKDEFELREKRLNLAYKILYPAVVAWLAVLYGYSANLGKITPLYCGTLAVLTVSIANILFYLIGEFKCLRITTVVKEETKNDSDTKFVGIWDAFSMSLVVAVLLAFANMAWPVIISQWSISIAFLIGYITYEISRKIKNRLLGVTIRNMVMTLMVYAFFAVIQLV